LDEIRFEKDEHGPLELWTPLGADGQLSEEPDFALSCDISMGTGGKLSSYSVGALFNRQTGELVGIWADQNTPPGQFADTMIAMALWAHGSSSVGAFLGWEANGPGGLFTKRVKQRGYTRVYKRTSRKDEFGTKATKKLGWWTDKFTKRELIGSSGGGGFSGELESGHIVIHSAEVLKQCRQYTWDDGTPTHKKSKNDGTDEAEVGENHGDHVIACALGVVMCDRAHNTVDTVKATPLNRKAGPLPETCYQGRVDAARREEESSQDDPFNW
jgi:hypothetical protein